MSKSQTKKVQVVGQSEAPKATAPIAPVAVEIAMSFDDWWLQTQGKHKFRPELKESVRKHFEKRGFMDSRKYEAGLRDFGYRT